MNELNEVLFRYYGNGIAEEVQKRMSASTSGYEAHIKSSSGSHSSIAQSINNGKMIGYADAIKALSGVFGNLGLNEAEVREKEKGDKQRIKTALSTIRSLID